MKTPWLAALGIAALVSGCVSSRAGLPTTRDLVYDRTGVTIERTEPGVLQEDAHARLQGGPLDADGAVAVAMANSPRLQVELASLELARARLLSASLISNPTAEGEVYFPVGDKADERKNAAEVVALFDLSDLWLVPLDRAEAAAELEAEELETAGAALELAYRTRVAFYRYVTARRQLGLAQEALVAAAASYEFAQRISEAGNIPDLELARQTVAFEEARLRVAEREVDLVTRRTELDTLMGVWGEAAAAWETVELLDEPPTADELELPDDIEARVVSGSLELAAQERRYAAAAASSDAALARGILPELRAGVAAEAEFKDETEEWSVGPAVELTLPLFDQNQGELAEAEARMERAEARYAALAIELRAAARTSGARVKLAARRAQFMAVTLVPLRTSLTDLVLLHVNAMDAGIFELLETRRRAIEARALQLDAVRDYWIEAAALETLLAGHRVDLPGTDAARDLSERSMGTGSMGREDRGQDGGDRGRGEGSEGGH